ncbi:ATP-binding domain-containing protein [Paenibacillus sp. XY044]|uniref:ATP-binding domain-containing protein n=1 Tax=Paenibacillus sp. XY044 TaxID=2026089 RepID=UPI000B9889F8|nr:ATP-binding domain-containing protein [Paenibacillus sp. XY044]OZB98040.1 hypothetical protein CJP46_02420 [Paenibacillus sp. XY044]
MSLIELKLTPERMMYPKSEALNKNDFRIYACTSDSADVEKNGFGNISIKGIMQRLELGTEYTAQITLDKIDPKYGASYNVLSIYQDVPETLDGQREFLATLMTEMQLEEVYKTYPDADVIDLILNDKFDYKQVKYFGEKTYLKIKHRIKENIVGTVQINKYIQSIVNPECENKKQHEYGKDNDNVIRVGDFVLNTVNMYQVKNLEESSVDIVNGDAGKVLDIKFEDDKRDDDDEDLLEREKKGIIIGFDSGAFRIDFNDVFQLLAGWCRTGHKAQGDSAPAVLSIVDRSHKFQVSANMLYTMLTRAKKKGILITQSETINFAIRKVESKRRNTHLCELLKHTEAVADE